MSKDNIFGGKGASPSDDIMSFILKKCQEPDIDNKKVIYLYLKSYINALIKTYTTTKNINYAIACADLSRHIFNIIYNYTHNVRVSIFMIERTIFLFNEYLNVSESITSIEIHINEIKSFIIHKTVGSINLNDKMNKVNMSIVNDITILQYISDFLKNIFVKLLDFNIYKSNIQSDDINIISDDDKDPLVYHMEQTMLVLHTIFYRLLYIGLNGQLEIILDDYFNNFVDTIEYYPNSVNILRIRLELFLYIEQTFKDVIKAKYMSQTIINENMKLLKEDETMNEYIDYTQSIKNNIQFIRLKDLVS
jgi:hypothetical protein